MSWWDEQNEQRRTALLAALTSERGRRHLA